MKNTEIERKFLVRGCGYRKDTVKQYRIRQGYIAHDGGNTVRIRIRDDEGFLTIKGPTMGLSRFEWETKIRLEDAEALFTLAKSGRIEKIRNIVPLPDGRKWEVDEFLGENEGLVMAEIELRSEDEDFPRPGWLAEEVTGDRRYYNSYLSVNPFKKW